MALSQNWTYMDLWREIVMGKRYDPNAPQEMTRFKIMNRAIAATADIDYDLVSKFYMTDHTIMPDTVCRFSASGTVGTYTTATRTLICSTLNTNFAAGDVGKTIVFRLAAAAYLGQIYSVTNTTTVILLPSPTIPTVDLASLDDVTVLPTPPTSQTIYIGSLVIKRTGTQVKSHLVSTSTKQVVPVDLKEVTSFNSSDIRNLDRIVWTFQGDSIMIAKGDNVATYGTLTLYYPRVPVYNSDDSVLIDLPDGIMTDIAIWKGRQIVAEQNSDTLPDYDSKMMAFVKQLYQAFGAEATAQQIQDKVMSLR